MRDQIEGNALAQFKGGEGLLYGNWRNPGQIIGIGLGIFLGKRSVHQSHGIPHYPQDEKDSEFICPHSLKYWHKRCHHHRISPRTLK